MHYSTTINVEEGHGQQNRRWSNIGAKFEKKCIQRLVIGEFVKHETHREGVKRG